MSVSEFEKRREHPLGEVDRDQIRDLASDLERVWQADTTSMEDRKALVRFLNQAGSSRRGDRSRKDPHRRGVAHRSPHANDDRAAQGWGVGAEDTASRSGAHPRVAAGARPTTSIAAKLNEEGFQTAKGLKYDDRAVGYVARTRGWGLGRGKRAQAGEGVKVELVSYAEGHLIPRSRRSLY